MMGFWNVVNSLVELSRITYQEPDLPPSHSKSEVILAKKTVLIGEVVNGGSLPSPPQHRPVCSFDSQNKYRGEGPVAEPAAAQFKGNTLLWLTKIYTEIYELRLATCILDILDIENTFLISKRSLRKRHALILLHAAIVVTKQWSHTFDFFIHP